MTEALAIVPLSEAAPDAIEALLDRAFGPDRHSRTAYRVRQGLAPIEALSFAAYDDGGRLVGCIQAWPVALAGDDGRRVPMVMVGPVAVEPALQRSGLGRRLMRATLDTADASADPGHAVLMLIGDPEYYARFFRFGAAHTGQWRLPGPFERHRLLARAVKDVAVPPGPGEVVGR